MAQYFAEGARVVGRVNLGEEVSVWYNAVLRGDMGAIEVGDCTNVQDNAVLHAGEGHHLTIGSHVSIGHSAVVHGCTVGDGTLIGMGAIVLNGAVIGCRCTVGAGALVTGKTNAPDGSLLVGSPAKVVRMLTGEEQEANRAHALHYLEAAKQSLRPAPTPESHR